MKNIEKHLDRLLDNTDTFDCVCCALRCGHDPCGEEDVTPEECDKQCELNKAWLKAIYVPKEAVYILKELDPKYTHIERETYGTYISYEGNEDDLSDIFKKELFEFLPLRERISISDLLQYEHIY